MEFKPITQLCQRENLCMLYYLQYFSDVSESAVNTYLHGVMVKQNNIVRAKTQRKKHSHITKILKKLNLLKFVDIYTLAKRKLMYSLINSKLPTSFPSQLIKICEIRNYDTRQLHNSLYF